MERKFTQVSVLFVIPVLMHTVVDGGVTPLNVNLVEVVFLVHISTTDCLLHQLFSILGQNHV